MKGNQQEREKRCHEEADEYYYLVDWTESERKAFHLGVEFGAAWVDNGDKTEL